MIGQPSPARLAASVLGMVWSLLDLACTRTIEIPPQRCGEENPFTYIEARLVSGGVMFPVQGGAPERWAAIGGIDPSVTGTCATMFGSGRWPPPLSGSLSDLAANDDGTLWVSCLNGPWHDLLIHGVVASRLSLGTHVWPTMDPSFNPSFDSISIWPISCSSAPSYRISVEVARAAGGPLPYPDMVTPDYVRSLTIRLEGMTDRTSVCAIELPTMELSFIESAADVVHGPVDQACL